MNILFRKRLKRVNQLKFKFESEREAGLTLTLTLGVLLLITSNSIHPRPEILFTLRTETLTSHGGEVSFPGGKRG
jgi:hypothetical protein